MKNKKVICFIPARGGSKSIPFKNIVSINNKELINYTIDQALKIEFFDKVIVSTDSKKIINKISNYKLEKKFEIINRPKKYSLDSSSTEEALNHTLKFLKTKFQYIPSYIIILEPTSPIRKILTIKKFIKDVINNKKYNSFISISYLSADPLYLNKKNELTFLRKNQPRRRQLRQKLFIEGCGMYGINYKKYTQSGRIITKPIYPFIVSKIESIDINDNEDLHLSEIILKNFKND